VAGCELRVCDAIASISPCAGFEPFLSIGLVLKGVKSSRIPIRDPGRQFLVECTIQERLRRGVSAYTEQRILNKKAVPAGVT
jgi:hypothetical protein